MVKTNEITIARNAIKKAIKAQTILIDISAMHRVAFDSIKNLCVNESVASELAYCAAKDVKMGY
jgi:hypothetical protein